MGVVALLLLLGLGAAAAAPAPLPAPPFRQIASTKVTGDVASLTALIRLTVV